jgi:hypothetical protein
MLEVKREFGRFGDQETKTEPSGLSQAFFFFNMKCALGKNYQDGG